MSTLPYECIALIVEQIDEPKALFNLLTINKVVFPMAAQHLYRDPIRYLRNKTIMPSVLFRGLLLLSSNNDSTIQPARQALRAPLRKECDPPLMLDYLNYIRIFDMRFVSDDYFPNTFFYGSLAGLPKHDLWYAIVSNHLSNLQELATGPREIKQYIDLAPQLSSVARIIILVSWENYLDQVKELVLALQQYHGPNQIVDCEFYPSFFDPIQDYYVKPAALQGVFSLLPPFKSPSLAHPHADGSPAVLCRFMDRELLRLNHAKYYSGDFQPRDLRLCHHDLSDSQILQRCRALEKLDVEVTRKDTDLFSWAVYEMEQRHQQQPEKQRHQRVDLKYLQMEVYEPENYYPPLSDVDDWAMNPPSNDDDWIMKTVDDALRGFSHSLKCVTLNIGGYVPLSRPQWELPMRCPNLRTLVLRVPWGMILSSASTWEQVPVLEYLELDVKSPENQWWPLGVPGSLHPGSGLRVCHQALRELRLQNVAVVVFDPASLEELPRLQRLDIRMSINDMKHISDYFCTDDDDDTKSTIPSENSSAFSYTLYPWTWTRPLPALKSLYLDLHVSIINFKSFNHERYPGLSVHPSTLMNNDIYRKRLVKFR